MDNPSNDPSGDGYVTLLRMLTRPTEGKPELTAAQWNDFSRDACRLKWVDEPALHMAAQSAGELTLLQVSPLHGSPRPTATDLRP